MRRLLPIAVLLLGLLWLPAAPASASQRQSVTFEAPRDLMDPARRPAALAELNSLGVRSLRVILTWKDVAPDPSAAVRPDFDPTDPAGYAWGQYDPLMASANALGWPVLMTISGPVPVWATAAKRDDKTRPEPGAFEAFVTAVGRRYGAQVGTWAIWNEPNQPQFLRPQYASGGKAVSPGMYRLLYEAALRGLTASGQSADRILIAETSPRGNRRVVAPLRFLRGMLCLDGRYVKRKSCSALRADGYAHHAYTTKQGPFFVPPVPSSRDDVTIGVLSRLTSAIDRATKAKAFTKRPPIHLTEFGIQSTPDTQSGVSLTKQVEYRAISERIAWSNPRVASFSQYLLTDSDPTGPREYGGFESGLRFADSKPKPSLVAFRLPLAVRRTGSKVSGWGLVRPAAGATYPIEQTVTITYADRRSSGFKTLLKAKIDARGYFRFTSAYRAGRRWNVRWQSFSGSPVGSYTVPSR